MYGATTFLPQLIRLCSTYNYSISAIFYTVYIYISAKLNLTQFKCHFCSVVSSGRIVEVHCSGQSVNGGSQFQTATSVGKLGFVIL